MSGPASLPSTRPSRLSDQFHTTRWTLVVRSKQSTAEGLHALRDLCAAYYTPVLAFLRREGRTEDGARELAHEFFERVLEGGAFGGADQTRGRFRSYLCGAVKHFVGHRREAGRRLRRNAGVQPLSIDAAPSDLPMLSLADDEHLPPDAAFDRQWALTVLARALEAIRRECEASGQAETFAQLRPWLTGESEHGDQNALAECLGMNLNSLKSLIHRLRRRFRVLVKAEVQSTLEHGASVEDEMNVLFAALRGR